MSKQVELDITFEWKCETCGKESGDDPRPAIMGTGPVAERKKEIKIENVSKMPKMRRNDFASCGLPNLRHLSRQTGFGA